MKPTNKIKRHHYKSDCQIIEQFYSYDDGTAVQVPVPERIKIEYYIDKGKGSIVVERKGDYCHNCSVSDDGMTLIAAIPLAKHPIGCGRLLCDKVEYIDDPLFPGGYKVKVTPMLTSIELWSQASDNDKSSAYGELLLAKIIRGKDGVGVPAGGSAGQVLSKKGDADYDTEWVDVPQGGGSSVDVVDNLTTADPTKVLSANMGKVLNEKFQYKNYLAGKNLDQKGNILDADGWNVTTPIAVVGGTALTFECGGTNTSALCEYDANGNFLDYWSQNVHPRTITTKANTAYVRLTVPSNPEQDYYISQNDVVLFNKLRKFDIVEQVANLDESAIEVTPLLSIENDIYPAHMRLIVEWSNEDAEVLQPIAYDSSTGLFEVETMPSWLAEDGAIVNSCINYSSTVLQTDVWNTCPKPQGNEASGFYIKRITETQVMLFTDSKAEVAATIPSTVKAEHFYFNQAIAVGLSLPQLSEGVKRYRIVLENVGYVPSKYKRMSVSGYYTYIGSNISPNFYDLGLGYVSQEVVLSNIDIILLVDHGEYTARYESIKCEATLRTGDDKAEAKVYRTLFGEMQAIYYANKPNITFGLSGARIKANSTIKLYEIVE